MASDSNGSNQFNAVFIDTNLETHLAMIVSDNDTVLDLKNKIAVEHPKCFPDIGTIKINALKVKRKQFFYHLSDFMLVRSAFDGAKKSWFLSLDASTIAEHSDNKLSWNPDSSNQPTSFCITDNHLGEQNNTVPDGCLMRLAIPNGQPLLQLEENCNPDQDAKNHVASGPGDSRKALESDNLTNKTHHNLYEEAPKSRSPAKKKRKTKKNAFEIDAASEKDDFCVFPSKEVSKQDIMMPKSANELKDANTASLDGSVEPLGNVVASKASFGIENRKRKRKSSNTDSEVVGTIPSVDDHGKENSVEAPEIRSIGSDREPDATTIDGQSAHGAISTTFSLPIETLGSGNAPKAISECENQKGEKKSVDLHTELNAAILPVNDDSQENSVETLRSKFVIPDKEPDAMVVDGQTGQGATSTTSPSLSGEAPRDANVSKATSKTERGKRKKKLSNTRREVNAAIPSVTDQSKGNSVEVPKIRPADSDREPDETFADGQSAQSADLTEITSPVQGRKHTNSLQEVGEENAAHIPSDDINKRNASCVETIVDSSKLAAASKVDGSKIHKKHVDVTEKGSPDVINPDSLGNDIIPSNVNNTVSGDHDFGSKFDDRVVSDENDENARKGVSLGNAELLDHSKTELNTAKRVASSNLPDMGTQLEPVNTGSKKKKSKKHGDIAVEGSPNVMKHDSLGNDFIRSHDDNTVPGDHDFGSNMFQRFEEDKVVSDENSQRGVSLENTEPLDHGKTQTNTAKGGTPSTLPEIGKHMDPVNTGSKKRKSKKTADSGARNEAASGTQHSGGSSRFTSTIEPHKDVDNEDSSNEAKKEQSILCERTRVSKTETAHASPSGSDTESCEGSGNKQEYWTHKKIHKMGNVNNVDVKMQKKAKKQQASTAKNISDMPTAKQTSNPNDPTTLKDDEREVNVPSKTKRKKSAKTVSSNQTTGSTLEAEQNAVVSESLHPRRSFGVVMSAHASPLGSDTESFEGSGNEEEYWAHKKIRKTGNVNNVDEKMKKIAKKQQASTAKNISDTPTAEQTSNPKDPTILTRETNVPSKTKRKISAKTVSLNQTTGSTLEAEQNAVESESSHPQRSFGLVMSAHASPLGSDAEAYEGSGNEQEYWAHRRILKTGNVKNVDEKMQKKAKKLQASTAKNISDLPTAEQTSNPKDPTTLKDEQREVNVPSKTKKNKSAKTVLSNQTTGSILEAQQNAVESECLHPQRSFGLVISAKTVSKFHEGDNGKAGEDKIQVHTIDTVHAKVNHEVGAYNIENDRINITDYFAPSEDQDKVTTSAEVPANKAVKGSESILKRKKGEKANGLVTETSADPGNSLKPKKIQRSEVGSNNASIGVFRCSQESLQEEENNETFPHSKRSLQITRNGFKVPDSQHRNESKPRAEEVKRAKLVDTLRTNSSGRLHGPCSTSGAHSDALSSGSESSGQGFHPRKKGKIRQVPEDHYHVKVQKATRKNMGVLDSRPSKRLIVTSGSIFKDESSDSSEDEEESKNSDASTRTPSTSSSDSEGESIQSGSHALKTSICGNIIDIQSSTTKNISLDTILRSSSRYRRAKLIASQSQPEDSES